jgi:trehalose 6-phosphate phosphatase
VLLPEPVTAAGRSGLAALLAEPARAVVAVDFDGTLAPIVARPEDARPAPGAVEALAVLADRIGICAVVTGRAAADAVRLASLESVPRVRVVGHYGLEEWVDGLLEGPPPSEAVTAARAALRELLAAAPPGVHLEDKEHSLAVHTRPAADPAGALAALTPPLEQLAADLGLETVPGRYVLELRPAGVDKGYAVRRLVDEAGARALVYVGDDLADLPAFDAVEALRHAGVPGLAVASVDPRNDDVPSEPAARADLVVAGPDAVVGLLRALAAAVGQP